MSGRPTSKYLQQDPPSWAALGIWPMFAEWAQAMFTQTFSYDHLDRITAFNDTGTGNERDFAWDNFGNMALKSWKGDMTPSAGSVVLSSSYPGISNIDNQSTNRLNDGTKYDSAGNVKDVRVPLYGRSL